ncbi:MAG: alkaline phosphatase D family protein [Pirellulales bacterium]
MCRFHKSLDIIAAQPWSASGASAGLGLIMTIVNRLTATCLIVSGFGVSYAAEWPRPVANDVLPYATSGLTHGPMLGGVSSNSVRIWLRSLHPQSIDVVYGTTLPLTDDSPMVSGETKQEHDNIGLIELGSLLPATRYYYGIRIDGQLIDTRVDFHDQWPAFQTLENAAMLQDAAHNPDGLSNISFAIGHCMSQEPGPRSGGHYSSPPVFDTLLRHHGDEVRFCIINGDIIYEEERDGTLEGVRANYRLYYERGRSLARLARRIPLFFTFDDHDVGWDIHGCGEIGLGDGRHLMRDIGLSAYQEYAAWANADMHSRGTIRFGSATMEQDSDILVDESAHFRSLRLEAVSTIHVGNYTREAETSRRPKHDRSPLNAGVYGLVEVLDDHRLRVRPAFKESGASQYSIGTHHYYDWQHGNCHFIALDTRGERSRFNASNRRDSKTFILSQAQEEWFLDTVRSTDADFIFVISPDPWTIYHTAAHVSKAPGADHDDKGDGFPSFLNQRERLLESLDTVEKKVLIFSGDVHHAASVRISDNIWEFLCGPLASTGHPLATLGNPPTGGSWESMGRNVTIRWLSAFPNDLPYQRIRNAYYGVVQVNNVAEVGTPTGHGIRYVAYQCPTVTIRWHDAYDGRMIYAETVSASPIER